jgi:hypothetical protein
MRKPSQNFLDAIIITTACALVLCVLVWVWWG